MPRRGGSNEYSQSVFLSRDKKIIRYPCEPQLYYIKVGFKGIKIMACFRDGYHEAALLTISISIQYQRHDIARALYRKCISCNKLVI